MLPDDLTTLTPEQLLELFANMAAAGADLVKLDSREPEWRQVDVVADKAGLESVTTWPLAPIRTSRSLLTFPVYIEASGTAQQAENFVTRMAGLLLRADTSHLHVLPRGDGVALAGAVLFVVGAPDDDVYVNREKVSLHLDDDLTGIRNPFTPSPELEARVKRQR